MKIPKDKKLLIKSLILMLFLTSCATPYRSLLIETARPSSQLLPDKIRSLTLVNRSITGDFKNFNEDSIQQYFFNRGFDFDAVVLDSIAADTTLRALGELLFESGRYDVVIPEERNLDRNAKFYMVPESLDWDEVSRLCAEFNTDALLVVERYFNKIMTDYDINVFPQYASASINSKYDAVIKIYDPLKKEIIRHFSVSDTISWQDADGSTKKLFARLPSIKECLIQTGIQVALDIDDRLSPNWAKETRIYFLLEDTDQSQISLIAREQRWQEAYDYWLTFSTSSKKSIKSKAEFNLALASEMLGNLELAIEWANKSYYTKYMNQTNNYLLKLKQRKQILERFQN
ncbi:DUF6340 family protein [Mangrovibacterium sp.]|uniref:DUF6340 family protein n=1 Tax=Mangrovibacterium sp. TaxID=1961364 RepID=UPI00356AA93C